MRNSNAASFEGNTGTRTSASDPMPDAVFGYIALPKTKPRRAVRVRRHLEADEYGAVALKPLGVEGNSDLHSRLELRQPGRHQNATLSFSAGFDQRRHFPGMSLLGPCTLVAVGESPDSPPPRPSFSKLGLGILISFSAGGTTGSLCAKPCCDTINSAPTRIR